MHAPNPRYISVDRLEEAAMGVVHRSAEDDSVNRTGPFEGWAVVSRDVATSNGRAVGHTPRPGNPYHADIVLPLAAENDHAQQVEHAYDLALASWWHEKTST